VRRSGVVNADHRLHRRPRPAPGRLASGTRSHGNTAARCEAGPLNGRGWPRAAPRSTRPAADRGRRPLRRCPVLRGIRPGTRGRLGRLVTVLVKVRAGCAEPAGDDEAERLAGAVVLIVVHAPSATAAAAASAMPRNFIVHLPASERDRREPRSLGRRQSATCDMPDGLLKSDLHRTVRLS